ncbi:MAG: hypothetical protein OWQ59_09620 [Alicyclobacillaceae bacterium]|jgi:hypothetical protein|uniref:hypothetical protein n=1 Tax=Alicyclobacillus sp. SP_1 TaxID=2942475 RepID=UPI002157061C|nr:hypothetical protein [Alicyclobacillus sp. SP_1]MCY0888700.1 hypothetical protein [Alicyclobacillaceae bacterium]MCY0895597.1 hypothetical protein [Alicyclobacillaceae bacterium]
MKENRLNARLRAIQWWGLGLIALTCIAWVVLSAERVWVSGLLLGELGGAVVVLTLIRGGQPNSQTTGAPLLLSGIVGTILRFGTLAVVMVVASKWHTVFNPYMTLVGFLLGFVFIFVGLYGIARNQDTTSSESR